MCLLALFFRVVDDAPVVVGANREEAYARGGEPPQLLRGACRFAAGLDPRSGGTWLGVNEHGLLVAVTNRPRTNPPAQPRSRGLLVRDLLSCRDAVVASNLAAKELTSNVYAGCNIVCVDSRGAYVLQFGDWLRVRPCPPGIHVLTSRDANDPSDPRTTQALATLSQHGYDTAADCAAALTNLCRGMCLRGEAGGTVSSTIVTLRPRLRESTLLHAQGPPDSTPYDDYSHVMRGLAMPA